MGLNRSAVIDWTAVIDCRGESPPAACDMGSQLDSANPLSLVFPIWDSSDADGQGLFRHVWLRLVEGLGTGGVPILWFVDNLFGALESFANQGWEGGGEGRVYSENRHIVIGWWRQ